MTSEIPAVVTRDPQALAKSEVKAGKLSRRGSTLALLSRNATYLSREG